MGLQKPKSQICGPMKCEEICSDSDTGAGVSIGGWTQRGEEEYPEKIFTINSPLLYLNLDDSRMSFHSNLLLSSEYFLSSTKRDGDVYLRHESGPEQLWERLSDLLP